ncbi:glycerate kinase [Bacillus sp. REN10]|nr:glycerate kinase [Bacillus sp. REN10]
MNILVAPDSFKGSLSAMEVGKAIGRGVKAAVCEILLENIIKLN